MSVLDRGIDDLAALVRGRQVSPVELVRESLQRIEADRELNAYITVLGDRAMKAARASERDLMRGNVRGPLHGLPVALKDNIDTAGIRTTGGSRVFADRVPTRDAPVWRRLRRAGAVLVGKTCLHEFAYAGPHPDFGPTHNPFRRGSSPGGSSSGSAVAVAAGHVVAALGTDTGGSVRQPAAFCGVVGVKPGPDVLSRVGILPLAPSLDCVGVLARTARDAEVVLEVLGGARWQRRPEGAIGPGTAVGIARAQAGAPISEPVLEALQAAGHRLETLGARLRPVDLPPLEELHAMHRVVLGFEARSAHQATLDSRPDDYGPALRAALLGASTLTPGNYLAAQGALSLYAEAVVQALEGVDVLLAPVASVPAPPMDPVSGRPRTDANLTRWTFFANFAALSALSVPTGLADGLPLAVQLVGHPGSERVLMAAARACEAPPARPRAV